MSRRIRREILIETEEILVMRKRRFVEIWCPLCSEQAVHFTPQDASIASGLSLKELADSVQSGRLHCAEDSGDRFICLNSVLNQRSIKGESLC